MRDGDALQVESEIDKIFQRDIDKDGDKDAIVILEGGDRYVFVDVDKQTLEDFLI